MDYDSCREDFKSYTLELRCYQLLVYSLRMMFIKPVSTAVL